MTDSHDSQTPTHNEDHDSDQAEDKGPNFRQVTNQRAPLMWMASGIIAAIILMGLFGWVGSSLGWFGAKNTANKTTNNGAAGTDSSDASKSVSVEFKGTATTPSNNGQGGAGGASGAGGAAGQNGTNGSNGSNGSNGNDGNNGGDNSGTLLNLDLGNLVNNLTNGLTKQQVLDLAGGLLPTCENATVPIVGTEEICTFKQDNKAVVTTFLNGKLITVAKIGF